MTSIILRCGAMPTLQLLLGMLQLSSSDHKVQSADFYFDMTGHEAYKASKNKNKPLVDIVAFLCFLILSYFDPLDSSACLVQKLPALHSC